MLKRVSDKLKQANWGMIEAIATMGLLIFAVAALYYSIDASNTANSIAQTSLKLSNYNTTIVPYVIEANLGIVNITGSSYIVNAYGNVSLSLIVMTPHDLILNISNPQSSTTFTFRNDTQPVNGQMLPVLNQNELSSNLVMAGPLAEPTSFRFPSAEPPYFQQYESFVQPGVTQVNFTIPVYGYFNLNPLVFTESGQVVPFGFLTSLANFNVQIKVYDVQTGQTVMENYSGTLDVWIWANPPFA